jgi:hypothetical protein
MLICVCLRILVSSRIPQYDLGRQTPHFWGGSVTVKPPSLPVRASHRVVLIQSSVCYAHPRPTQAVGAPGSWHHSLEDIGACPRRQAPPPPLPPPPRRRQRASVSPTPPNLAWHRSLVPVVSHVKMNPDSSHRRGLGGRVAGRTYLARWPRSACVAEQARWADLAAGPGWDPWGLGPVSAKALFTHFSLSKIIFPI